MKKVKVMVDAYNLLSLKPLRAFLNLVRSV